MRKIYTKRKPKEPEEWLKLKLIEEFFADSGTVMREDGYIGSLNRHGYRQFKFKRNGVTHTIVAHHISWFLNKGVWPEHEIDHEDRNRENNDITNLKYSTPREQSFNKTLAESNLGLPRGVRARKSGYYEAYATIKGKKIYVGQSKDPWIAGKMYDDFIEKHGGGNGNDES